MNQSTASIIAAVIAGLVGILIGLIAAGVQYRMKSDELFYKALDFLDGGTQRRNLGIAAIELSWTRRRFRPISTSLLIGCALYLLLESQTQAAHEVHNLRRIMKRLLHDEAYKVGTQAEYGQLQAAVQKARQAAEARESGTGTALGISRGLIISKEELREWENVLARMLSHANIATLPAIEETNKNKFTH
ncbi:MAG TPA: hypothetical protein VKR42_02035 [Ktedonobacteraceae bacterium]|nr:hypothetical protein [Ktedonobacteraceae bacterium]